MKRSPKENLLSIVESFGDIGLYAKEVKGDRFIGHNENQQFLTCSCYKVITAIALYRKLRQEESCDLDLLPYRSRHRVAGSGILKMMRPHTNSIFNYLVLMLRQSDNTATHILEEYVTKEEQDRVIQDLRLEKTLVRLDIRDLVNDMGLPREATPEDFDARCIERNAVAVPGAPSVDLLRSNVSSPYELTKVLDELMHPTLIDEKDAQKILGIMKQYDPDDRIVEYGKYIEIANKGGWAVGTRADMNIVFAENPFSLVLMAKDLTNPERNRLVGCHNEILRLAEEQFSR